MNGHWEWKRWIRVEMPVHKLAPPKTTWMPEAYRPQNKALIFICHCKLIYQNNTLAPVNVE